ncbi:hypothetical protein BJ170DRAFT_684953 [Xylariales sp. AK1849]|nr:hypothetical protein BJ170DRAFT_684953 [Xylariales sp. AK1849]
MPVRGRPHDYSQPSVVKYSPELLKKLVDHELEGYDGVPPSGIGAEHTDENLLLQRLDIYACSVPNLLETYPVSHEKFFVTIALLNAREMMINARLRKVARHVLLHYPPSEQPSVNVSFKEKSNRYLQAKTKTFYEGEFMDCFWGEAQEQHSLPFQEASARRQPLGWSDPIESKLAKMTSRLEWNRLETMSAKVGQAELQEAIRQLFWKVDLVDRIMLRPDDAATDKRPKKRAKSVADAEQLSDEKLAFLRNTGLLQLASESSVNEPIAAGHPEVKQSSNPKSSATYPHSAHAKPSLPHPMLMVKQQLEQERLHSMPSTTPAFMVNDQPAFDRPSTGYSGPLPTYTAIQSASLPDYAQPSPYFTTSMPQGHSYDFVHDGLFPIDASQSIQQSADPTAFMLPAHQPDAVFSREPHVALPPAPHTDAFAASQCIEPWKLMRPTFEPSTRAAAQPSGSEQSAFGEPASGPFVQDPTRTKLELLMDLSFRRSARAPAGDSTTFPIPQLPMPLDAQDNATPSTQARSGIPNDADIIDLTRDFEELQSPDKDDRDDQVDEGGGEVASEV